RRTKRLWRRLWKAVQPPPRVPGPHRRWNRSQKSLVFVTLGILFLTTAGLGMYQYNSTAEKRARAVFDQGTKLMNPGSYPEAIRRFDRAIEIWPQLAEAYLQRGNARVVLNLTDAALADFKLALDADPNLAAAYTARGMILVARGDSRSALKEFEQSVHVQ